MDDAVRAAVPGASRTATLPRSAWLLVALLTAGWGFNWPIMKVALRELPPWTFRSVCLACAMLTLFVIARAQGQSLRPPPGAWLPLSVVALCNVTAWSLFSVYGIKYLAAGRAAILAYTMPAWTGLLGVWLLREPLTRRRLLGLALGMLGMAALMGSEMSQLRAAPIGALFMLGAAWSWALGTVVFKRYPIAMPSAALTAWTLLLGGAPIWIATPLIEGYTLKPLSLWPTLATLYNMVIAFNLCYWAWQKIMTRASAGVSAMSTLMIPVLGVLSGMVLLGERPGWQELAALLLVLGALATVLLPSKAARGSPAR